MKSTGLIEDSGLRELITDVIRTGQKLKRAKKVMQNKPNKRRSLAGGALGSCLGDASCAKTTKN